LLLVLIVEGQQHAWILLPTSSVSVFLSLSPVLSLVRVVRVGSWTKGTRLRGIWLVLVLGVDVLPRLLMLEWVLALLPVA